MPHQQSEMFGRLLRGAVNAIACFEGKSAGLVEEELGDLIRMAPTAIQRFKTGYVPGNSYIIEALAEAGVKRAHLDRVWLRRFLQAARYYDAQVLIDRLCQPMQEAPPAPRMYHNLPAPTYSQFVMRPEPLAAVLDGLRQRTAVVVIVSLGGMGKTSLAREVATQCLAPPLQPSTDPGADTPRFDAVVWVSDKDRPGAITMKVVLDEIAHTLDYPGFTQFELARKRREVVQLLMHRRVLLIVDNFETIADAALLQWLLRLPEPSKALITTREYRSEFQQGAWLVELDGMSAGEASQFIAERARQLNLKHLPALETQRQIIALTGGNPKAIELLLGYVKSTGQPVAQIARHEAVIAGDLLADLFTTSWSALNQDARHILLAMTLFPTSVDGGVLAAVAGVGENAFFLAVRQLVELALLDIEQLAATQDESSGVRYTLHPLTRRFLTAQRAEYIAVLDAACERWLEWAVAYATGFGYQYSNIARLKQVDAEEASLAAALDWAFDHERYAETIQMAKGIEFYYYVRAWWGKKLDLHQKYIVSAHQIGDTTEEILALTMHIQLLSRQGNYKQAQLYLPRLETLIQSNPPHGECAFHVWHAQGLYYLAASDLAAAQRAWERILDSATEWALPDHMVTGTQHWLATCLYRQGRSAEARQRYELSLEHARAEGNDRMIARNQVQLASIDLEQGHSARAQQRLIESQAKTESMDWEQHSRIQQALAQLYEKQGNHVAAEQARELATDLRKRMGLPEENNS
jgi:hypothetical protein